jgi:hypothetical protein
MKLSEKEIKNKSRLIKNLDNVLIKLLDHFKKIYPNIQIERKHIFDSLFLLYSDKYDLEWPGDIWDIEIDFDEAKRLLTDFDLSVITNSIEVQSEIFPKDLLIQFKVRIKSKGLIWIIHKNDKDPFPSNPHAHELDNNIKLDLSNGNCYKKNQLIYTLRKRDLQTFREKASKIYKGELPKLMI